MSVSLEEVLTAAGYDIRNCEEDAQWFLGLDDEFDDLRGKADALLTELEYKRLSEEDDE